MKTSLHLTIAAFGLAGGVLACATTSARTQGSPAAGAEDGSESLTFKPYEVKFLRLMFR